MSAQFSSARLSCETQVMTAPAFPTSAENEKANKEIAIEIIQTQPD
jgi:hypothetical protein